MSRKLPKTRAEQICIAALRSDMTTAAQKYGMSKQRVSKIFRCHASTVFMHHELYDNDGKRKSFKELQHIFNSPL